MNLSVKDVGRLLGVSEKTVYRWIKQGAIPAYRIQEQYRFHRAEILEWATSRRLAVSPEIFDEPEAGGSGAAGLVAALKAGGIHYRLRGSDKASLLCAVVELLPLPEGTDRAFVAQMLLARENLGSTAVGGGVAIPHPRFPVILPPSPDTLSLCFLDEGVDFGALDGQEVRTLFVLISPTVKNHLRLLSRLAFALQDPALRDLLVRQADREALLGAFAAVDARTATTRKREP
jgi:PTS system nitrogen regulatory IIA component